jgi:tryptophan synthase alpha chain
MSRIAPVFEALRARDRRAVIPYIVAGDPAADITVDLMQALAEAGADIIELGVPFSDPMSEGPTIQRGHERALERGIRLRTALEIVAEFRKVNADTPVLLMGYANPVEHMGYANFADRAATAGVDALLTVDIPPEEVEAVNAELRRVAMDNIFLIAPTTPSDRMGRIASQASGFIYYVSLKGVTGASNLDQVDVASQIAEIRKHTDLPVCVGFGIKDGPSAAAVGRHADGVVIGSALVQRLADVAEQGGTRDDILAAARDLIADLRVHVDALGNDAAQEATA